MIHMVMAGLMIILVHTLHTKATDNPCLQYQQGLLSSLILSYMLLATAILETDPFFAAMLPTK